MLCHVLRNADVIAKIQKNILCICVEQIADHSKCGLIQFKTRTLDPTEFPIANRHEDYKECSGRNVPFWAPWTSLSNRCGVETEFQTTLM